MDELTGEIETFAVLQGDVDLGDELAGTLTVVEPGA